MYGGEKSLTQHLKKLTEVLNANCQEQKLVNHELCLCVTLANKSVVQSFNNCRLPTNFFWREFQIDEAFPA